MNTRQVTIRMPADSLAKWLAALRGGEYKQGAGFLRDSEGHFCCLGVLQHCHTGRIAPEAEEELPSFSWLNRHKVAFLDRFGDPANAPYLPRLRTDAQDANDHGAPFAEIADAIEACAEAL
jgi:hypothetical protein